MIPAVLCCIFVLYLYRTLNSPDVDDSAANRSLTLNEDQISAMEVRLTELRKRIEGIRNVASEETQS